MRTIRYIIIHCTASQPNASVQGILDHWKSLGWENPGYHYLIRHDGEILCLTDEANIANGARGYNQHAVHVAYIGGIDQHGKPLDTRTAEQKASMLALLQALHRRYPAAAIISHRDVNLRKACPSFDATKEYKGITHKS